MSSACNACKASKLSPESPLTLEAALKLLNWDKLPGVEPSEPEYPFLEKIFLEALENKIQRKGLKFVQENPHETLAGWNRVLAIY